jgi:hypothetical protein
MQNLTNGVVFLKLNKKSGGVLEIYMLGGKYFISLVLSRFIYPWRHVFYILLKHNVNYCRPKKLKKENSIHYFCMKQNITQLTICGILVHIIDKRMRTRKINNFIDQRSPHPKHM